jgi:hypothetical protein
MLMYLHSHALFLVLNISTGEATPLGKNSAVDPAARVQGYEW